MKEPAREFCAHFFFSAEISSEKYERHFFFLLLQREEPGSASWISGLLLSQERIDAPPTPQQSRLLQESGLNPLE